MVYIQKTHQDALEAGLLPSFFGSGLLGGAEDELFL
jgi:hypothetical protein